MIPGQVQQSDPDLSLHLMACVLCRTLTLPGPGWPIFREGWDRRSDWKESPCPSFSFSSGQPSLCVLSLYYITRHGGSSPGQKGGVCLPRGGHLIPGLVSEGRSLPWVLEPGAGCLISSPGVTSWQVVSLGQEGHTLRAGTGLSHILLGWPRCWLSFQDC